MKGIDKKIRDIKEQKIGNSQKKALIVEGIDDVRSFELFLSKNAPDWSSQWVLAEAGNKSAVLKMLEKESDWLGVIDRDEWDEEKIVQLGDEKGNLSFLPRYCIENYLIIPSELWAALPTKQKAKIQNGEEDLSARVLNDFEKWVKHGVLWSVINPLWEGLRSLGFKEALLEVDIATNDAEIQRILGDWHDFLNPDQIWQLYLSKLQEVEEKTVEEKLKLHVHGKYFYQQVVNPALNELLGQKSAEERQFAILRTLPVTTDLNPLFRKMGLDLELSQ